MVRKQIRTLKAAPDLDLGAAAHVEFGITVLCITAGIRPPPVPGDKKPPPPSDKDLPPLPKGRAALLSSFSPTTLENLEDYQVSMPYASLHTM